MKRDQLIGLWLSKPLFDHVDQCATDAGVTRPEFIRQILLTEYLNTQADQIGCSTTEYVGQLVEQGRLDELTNKKLEEFILNLSAEESHGRQQQHSG